MCWKKVKDHHECRLAAGICSHQIKSNGSCKGVKPTVGRLDGV